MDRPSWAPVDVDLSQPSVARVYDYFLGGSHNFAADRAFADRVLSAVPDVQVIARENRAFLRRAVRYLLERGVRQFVDMGSGIPTVGNVHETAQRVDRHCKIVYVDHDPVAVAHSKAILADNPGATILSADLREPREILTHPSVDGFLDLTRPVGLLLVAVLHFVPEQRRAEAIVREAVELLPHGSYVVISHASAPESYESGMALYAQTESQLTNRTAEAITRLFGDLKVVEPGVVPLAMWHPEEAEDVTGELATLPGRAGVGYVG